MMDHNHILNILFPLHYQKLSQTIEEYKRNLKNSVCQVFESENEALCKTSPELIDKTLSDIILLNIFITDIFQFKLVYSFCFFALKKLGFDDRKATQLLESIYLKIEKK
jgi:hypothetical protein